MFSKSRYVLHINHVNVLHYPIDFFWENFMSKLFFLRNDFVLLFNLKCFSLFSFVSWDGARSLSLGEEGEGVMYIIR